MRLSGTEVTPEASAPREPVGAATVPESRLGDTMRSDTFFGMSVGDACKKYFAMMKQPESLKQIADAIEAGGLIHRATNFLASVSTAMARRAIAPGDIVRVKRGLWGLAEWYPNMKKRREGEPEA